MRTISIFIILILSSLQFAMAQEDNYYVAADTAKFAVDGSDLSNTPFSKTKKLDLGVSMGSSFGTFYGNSIFTNYLAPEIRYSFSPKFSITAGTMFTYSMSGNSLMGGENTETNASRQARYYLYAKGEYQVNEKLSIRAGGFAEVTPNSGPNGFKSGHVGMSFKLTEGTTFHADFQINSGYPSSDLYYSNGGVFGDPGRFGNYNANPYWGSNW